MNVDPQPRTTAGDPVPVGGTKRPDGELRVLHRLDGSSLTAHRAVALGRMEHPDIEADPQALARVDAAWELAERIAAARPVYGRTTGVGANRETVLAGGRDDALRLLRSHATGGGDLMDTVTVRTAMVIRLNQLLRGGSGMHPGIVAALTAALRDNRVPRVHTVGPIGTGDLTGLAEIGLALAGETPDRDGTVRRDWQPAPGDALPLISSNAVTLAAACVALERLRVLRRHLPQVAGLSFLALRAGREPLQRPVQRARPLPGQATAAAELLEALAGTRDDPARVQDSFGYRTYPQVTGGLIDALEHLEAVVTIEVNAAAENPLFDMATGRMFHNGNFHAMSMALALDQVKLALAAVGQLSLSRVADLSTPARSGLTAFLAEGEPGSSGMMLLEYVQAAAQSALRSAAQPATLGSVCISRGTENHASFATQATDQLHAAVEATAEVHACELVTALRALDLRGDHLPPDSPVGHFAARVRRDTDRTLTDRPLTADIAAAKEILLMPTG